MYIYKYVLKYVYKYPNIEVAQLYSYSQTEE